MKKVSCPFLSLYCFIGTIKGVFAVPASPTPFTVTQPDGTPLTLHSVGDECYHWVETEDNFSGTVFWDVMAMGSWNGSKYNSRCPAQHNPYTKAYIYKWIIPVAIISSVKNTLYEMTPSHNSTSFYRINTSTSNEFFLLEDRTKYALRRTLPDIPVLEELTLRYIQRNRQTEL
ncbi:MAG TPA: hypothetical protein DIW30_08290 [Bacteroidales bacterium]|nr:hypothetical protein [Bacteroidales bacterium]